MRIVSPPVSAGPVVADAAILGEGKAWWSTIPLGRPLNLDVRPPF